jgi:F420H(2)-dependent quinone reductase
VTNPYRALLLKWSPHPSFARFGKAVIDPLDRLVRPLGRPVSAIGSGLPTIYLTTTGRKTGQARTVAVLGVDLGGRIGVIDSNNREDKRPGWYYNLLAEPKCRVQRGRNVAEHVAHPADEAERDELWRRGLQVFPAWQAYAETLTRPFDMFILEPAP